MSADGRSISRWLSFVHIWYIWDLVEGLNVFGINKITRMYDVLSEKGRKAELGNIT